MNERLHAAINFLEYLRGIGVRAWSNGCGRLMVDPGSKLREGDADFIREHKAELLDALEAKRCPGVCPGASHEHCAGCPSPQIEIMFSGGLIASQWCVEKIEDYATHWRERGKDWIEINKHN